MLAVHENLGKQCALVAILVAFDLTASSHDIPVHQTITFHAQQSARDRSTAYAGFLDTISFDIPFVDATNSLVDGSALEDNIDVKGDAGKKRSLNHFYDPLSGREGSLSFPD